MKIIKIMLPETARHGTIAFIQVDEENKNFSLCTFPLPDIEDGKTYAPEKLAGLPE